MMSGLLSVALLGALCPPLSTLPDLTVLNALRSAQSPRSSYTGSWTDRTISLTRLQELASLEKTDADRVRDLRASGVAVYISDKTPDLSEVPVSTWPLTLNHPDLPRTKGEAMALPYDRQKLLEPNPELAGLNLASEESARKAHAEWLDSDTYALGAFAAPDPKSSFPGSDRPRIILRPHASKGTIIHEAIHREFWETRKNDAAAVQNPAAVLPARVKALEARVKDLEAQMAAAENPEERENLKKVFDKTRLDHVEASLDYLTAHIGEELDVARLLVEEGVSLGLSENYRKHSFLGHAEYLNVAKQYLNQMIKHDEIAGLGAQSDLSAQVSRIQSRVSRLQGHVQTSEAWQSQHGKALGLNI